MIYGNLNSLKGFLPNNVKKYIVAFISNVSNDTKDGIYELRGLEIYARVMSYDTHIADECKIEAHDKYVDIQCSLAGGERISIFPREKLIPQKHNSSDDVILFQPTINPYVYCNNYVGYFTMLFPNDAHRPMEILDNFKMVKKFVIKIDMQYFNFLKF